MKLTTLLALVAIGAIGMVGIDRYQERVAPAAEMSVAAPGARAPHADTVAMPVDCSRQDAGAIPMRWAHALLADALMRGSEVLHPALPEYEDGWGR
jgi:hypothetical protein